MSPEIKAPAHDQPASDEQFAQEWANVGLCGEMFRPAPLKPRDAEEGGEYDSRLASGINEADWQPNRRCCL